MLRTLRSGAAACAAVAGRLITVASVMFLILALVVERAFCSTLRCHHPPCAQLRTGAGDPVFQRRLGATEKARRTGSPPSRGTTAECVGPPLGNRCLTSRATRACA